MRPRPNFSAQHAERDFAVRNIGNECWDSMGASWEEGRQRLWREHSDAINRSLLAHWLPEGQTNFILKTDLFDEICGEGLFPFLSLRTNRIVGIDVSQKTIRIARSRHADIRGVAADVRRLPFHDDTFDLIFSNSTLDHFEKHETITESLAEIFRVLRQNGQLIITLDNLTNPMIAARNALPFRLLKRLCLTPYYVGATWGPRGFRNQLIQTGLGITEMDAVLHCPRVLAVAAAFIMERLAPRRLQKVFLQSLSCFELLKYLPTCFLTGHFVAVRAVKILSPALRKITVKE